MPLPLSLPTPQTGHVILLVSESEVAPEHSPSRLCARCGEELGEPQLGLRNN